MTQSSKTLEDYKSRFLDINVSLCIVVLVIYFIYFWFFYYSPQHIRIIFSLTVFFLIYYALRAAKSSLVVRTNFYCLSILLAVISVSFIAGGIKAPVNFWLPLIPFAAFALGDKKSAYFWVGSCLLWLAFGTYLHQTGYQFVNSLENVDRSVLNAIHCVLIIGYMTSVAHIWTIVSAALVKTQVKIVQSNEEVKRVKQVTALSAGFAHEINNPLAIISLINQKVARKISSNTYEGINKDLDDQQRVVDRINEVIHSLSFLSRRPRLLERSYIGLSPLIHKIIKELQDKYDYKVVTKVMIPGDIALFANSEPARILFHNIVRNAFDALETSHIREIEISTRRRGHIRTIAIQDSGPGVLDPDQVFELYHTSKSAEKGSGVGLALVKSICDIYGWKISVSNNHRGARFELEFEEVAMSKNFALQDAPPQSPLEF